MNLLIRSGLRAWMRRPAGPVLLLLGVLIATLFASATEVGLAATQQAQDAADAEALGGFLGRVWTPGGYTIGTDDLETVRADLAAVAGDRFLVFLERDGLLTRSGTTTSGWRVLGLPEDAFAGLGLPAPAPGTALFDPGARTGIGTGAGPAELRLQTAPAAEVSTEETHLGSLVRTVQVLDQYVHDDGDDYEFTVPVGELTKRLELRLVHDSSADLDLEAISPNGTIFLDDAGTAIAAADPFLSFDEPAPGDWTVRVHSKLAQNVAFRLHATHVFDARDAHAVGRLLQGLGWRAVGASLGLTEQVRLSLSLQDTDLSVLGPGRGGLLVVPLGRLQAVLDLPGQASGLLVQARGEDPLDGFPERLAEDVRRALRPHQDAAGDAFDPLQGIRLETTAQTAAEEREATLQSTRDLLLVVLPAGVSGGLLVAAWAAGLHARRMRSEVQTLASLGQSRRDTAWLALFHFLPPSLLGATIALLLAPLLGSFIAAGLGVEDPSARPPGWLGWTVAATGLVTTAIVVAILLRPAMRGADPRAGRRPAPHRIRFIVASGGLALGFLFLLLAWVSDPALGLLWGGLAAAAWVLALLWGPFLDAPLRGAPRVRTLGLYRLRSTHAALGQAGAAVALVLAAVLAGLGLSQAATPDPAVESGGYAVLGTTPAYTEDLSTLADAPGLDPYLEATLGIEYVMRVTGTGLVSGLDGETTVYGIDTSFAQRHMHRVEGLDGRTEPLRDVAVRDDAAVLSRDLWDALDNPAVVRVEGPLGALDYEVVGVMDTRILPGVYLAKEAVPVHFNQIGGEQRIRLAPGTNAEDWARGVGDRLKDGGLALQTDAARVADRLQGQARAGATLQVLGGLAIVTTGLLGVLVLLRARAERSTTDRVLLALGSRGTALGAGLVTEGMLPFLAAGLVAVPILVPLAARLDGMTGLAFPLNPIDGPRLVVASTLLFLGLILLAVGLGVVLAWRGARRRGGIGREWT